MEEKVRKMRKVVENLLKDNDVTFFEWSRIERYIDQKYERIKEESTL